MLTLKNGRGGRRLIVTGAAVAIAVAVCLAFVYRGGNAATGGGTSADTSLLDSVMHGMNTNLASVRLDAPPSDMSDTGTSKWLTATYAAGQTTAQDVDDQWYAALIAGGYGAQCAAQDVDCLAGFSFVSTDGPQEDDMTSRLVMQSVTMTSASSSDLSSTIERRLAAEGIIASSIMFVHPYGPAAVVNVQASDPQTVITNFNAGRVFGDLGLDGYLLQVADSTGNVVFVEDTANRAGAGGSWAASNLTVPNLPRLMR